jgi:hypothetical protein
MNRYTVYKVIDAFLHPTIEGSIVLYVDMSVTISYNDFSVGDRDTTNTHVSFLYPANKIEFDKAMSVYDTLSSISRGFVKKKLTNGKK